MFQQFQFNYLTKIKNICSLFKQNSKRIHNYVQLCISVYICPHRHTYSDMSFVQFCFLVLGPTLVQKVFMPLPQFVAYYKVLLFPHKKKKHTYTYTKYRIFLKISLNESSSNQLDVDSHSPKKKKLDVDSNKHTCIFYSRITYLFNNLNTLINCLVLNQRISF